MKQIATLSLAVMMLASAAGCYCGMPGWGYGYGAAPNCPGGNCYGTPGAIPGGTFPSGSYYNHNGYSTMQSAVPYAAPVSAGLPVYGGTVAAPLESLPTYY